jgi:hypothetical protein
VHALERDRTAIIDGVERHLRSCGFSASPAGRSPWGEVQLGNVAVRTGLCGAIDAHVSASVFLLDTVPATIDAMTRLFLGIARDAAIPVREASLDVAVTGGFPLFTWTSRSAEIPSGIRFAPDAWYTTEGGRTRVPPRLIFVGLPLLVERDRVHVSGWALAVDAALHPQVGRGVILDGAWSAWCTSRSVAVAL